MKRILIDEDSLLSISETDFKEKRKEYYCYWWKQMKINAFYTFSLRKWGLFNVFILMGERGNI